MRRFLHTLWSLFWLLFWLGVVAACAACIYNFARDDLDVQRMAEAAACEGEGCGLQQLRKDRTPLDETFEFFDAKKDSIRVRCAREHVLLGEYACEVRARGPYTGPVTLVRLPPTATAKGKGGGGRKVGPAAPSGSAGVPAGDGGL